MNCSSSDSTSAAFSSAPSTSCATASSSRICVEAVPVRPFRSTRKPRPVLSDTLYWRISPSFTDTSKLEPDS